MYCIYVLTKKKDIFPGNAAELYVISRMFSSRILLIWAALFFVRPGFCEDSIHL